MKAKIDLEKFICSYVKWNNIQDALKDQGLKCWNGEIVEISQESDNELKFHVGDFIKHNKNNHIYKVISINNNSCYIENIETGVRYEHFNAEQIFHLWTINDAKNGDVLVANNGLAFIYNGYLEEQQWPFAYGGINMYGRFNISDGLLSFTHQKVVPATKEQRDLLFQKMKEAEYEWDAEKKELKKIENKPLVIDEGKDEIDRSFTKMMLKDYTKQKPVEWSEEDKHKIEDIVYFLDAAKIHYAKTEELDACIDWLKSLRPSKWRPTPEQYKTLNSVINFAAESPDPYWHNTIFNILKQLRTELKTL